MTDLVHYIALSLLPSWSWLPIAERLRAGDPPAAVVDQLLATHWPGDPNYRSDVYARARAAIDRAEARRVRLRPKRALPENTPRMNKVSRSPA